MFERSKQACGRYYDQYLQKAHEYENQIPNFKVFSTETLDDKEQIEKLLNFLEIDEKAQRIQTAIRRNVGTFQQP